MKVVMRFRSGFELPITCDSFDINKGPDDEIRGYSIRGIKDHNPVYFRKADIECIYRILDGSDRDQA